MTLQGRYIGFLFFWIIIPGLTSSCSDKRAEPAGGAELLLKKKIIKPTADYRDTLKVESSAAVFYRADSSRREMIKNDFGKGAFESMNHECFYQAKNAKEVIRKNRREIKIVDASEVRYVEFVKNDGSKSVIDLFTKRELCGLLLFDRIKEPLPADMMNIDTELGFYFNRQKN